MYIHTRVYVYVCIMDGTKDYNHNMTDNHMTDD